MSEKKSWQETLSELWASSTEGLELARRVSYRDAETAAGWPPSGTMVVQLREALGLPIADEVLAAPAWLVAWEEALAEVRRIKEWDP